MITESMKKTMDECKRRREKQIEYNQKSGITPQTIYKTTEEIMRSTAVADIRKSLPKVAEVKVTYGDKLSKEELLERLEKEMRSAAANLEFERAAVLRDEINRIKKEKVS